MGCLAVQVLQGVRAFYKSQFNLMCKHAQYVGDRSSETILAPCCYFFTFSFKLTTVLKNGAAGEQNAENKM